jgi:hypothetical protein
VWAPLKSWDRNKLDSGKDLTQILEKLALEVGAAFAVEVFSF